MPDFSIILLSFVAMILSLTVHEFSHALAGLRLGDETARRMGRLTLNPLSHVDPIGTVLIPLLGALTGFPVFGWAKPVPYNVKYGKWGAVIIALAGPGSNFVFAAVAALLLQIVAGTGVAATSLLPTFLVLLILVNVVLGVFNFLPVPPLDGSKLADALLDSPQHRHILQFLHQRGTMILFGLILAAPVFVFYAASA